ncbi:MAG: histidine phosphatase family protein [Ilumatobacteraceae bacterium]
MTIHYISHPQVTVDPAVPVDQWGLSPTGRQRAAAMAAGDWVRSIRRIVSSAETKALETAALLGASLGVAVETRPASGEIDRAAAGFLPPDEFEVVADRCFAEPSTSARGWERAIDAQARIAATLADLLDDDGPGDVAVVGHGGVGTLWWCHLSGTPIERRWDQPGQGHVFRVDRASRRPLDHWWPIESALPGR